MENRVEILNEKIDKLKRIEAILPKTLSLIEIYHSEITIDGFQKSDKIFSEEDEFNFEKEIYSEMIESGLMLKTIFCRITKSDVAGLEEKFKVAEKYKTPKETLYKHVVSKDGIRPSMTGVYHVDGKKVATDAHILVELSNQTYPEWVEGLIIDKNGVKIDAKFPNYDVVIPSHLDIPRTTMSVDRTIKACLTILNIDKTHVNYEGNGTGIEFFSNIYLDANNLLRISYVAKSEGLDSFDVSFDAPSRAILFEGKNFRAIVMPLIKKDDLSCYNFNTVYDNATDSVGAKKKVERKITLNLDSLTELLSDNRELMNKILSLKTK